MDWMDLKQVMALMSVEKDALHIYAALAVQVAAALLFRRRLSSWLPWFIVLLAEAGNEALDLWLGEEAQVQQWQVSGAAHDLVNTMILPTALLLLCRYAPSLFCERPPLPAQARRADEEGTESG